MSELDLKNVFVIINSKNEIVHGYTDPKEAEDAYTELQRTSPEKEFELASLHRATCNAFEDGFQQGHDEGYQSGVEDAKNE